MAHAFLTAGNQIEVLQRCTKKVFTSSKMARRAMNNVRRGTRGLIAMGQGTMNAYRCGICGQWHIGHK